MHPITLLHALAAIPALVQAKTYYVDKSCTARPQWDTILAETFTMARRVSERLASSTDTDFENVLYQTLKIKKTDADPLGFQFVKDVFDDIKAWAPMADQGSVLQTIKAADVRIFCDEDEFAPFEGVEASTVAEHIDKSYRWVPLRQGATDYWWDFKNDMAIKQNEFCHNAVLNGYTYRGRLPQQKASETRGGQNLDRQVITICNRKFKPLDIRGNPVEAYYTFTDEMKKRNWPRTQDITAFKTPVSTTLLHEFMHAARPAIRDFVKPGTNSWKMWYNLPKDEAIKNADSYSYLGVWAMVADFGKHYSLPRIEPLPDMTDPEEAKLYKERVPTDSERGQMISYGPRLTSRALRGLAKWFKA